MSIDFPCQSLKGGPAYFRLSVNVFGSDPESQLSTLKLAAGFCWGKSVISSVLSCHSKDLKWQTSVTVRLQLSFIKQRIVHA